MARGPRTKLICGALIVALLAGMYPLQGLIERTRTRSELAASNPLAEIPAGEFFGTVLMGGFRAIAVDLIWMKAQDAQRNRDWHRFLLLNQLTASLQPRFIEVWIFNMWNMSYNLSLLPPTEREGWQWVKRGIAFGKEGFTRNPDSWRLAWSIGFQYYHKCGTVNDDRGEQYQRWLFEETGRTNWQHALEWFEKAYAEADGKGNPNTLSFLATTHRQMAFEAEEKGDLKAMIANRLKSIEWIERIQKDYADNPAFGRYAAAEIADLRGRLNAHELEGRARAFHRQGSLRDEFEALAKAAEFWKTTFEGNPYQDEQGRHLVAIATQFEELMNTAPADLKDRAAFERMEVWISLLYGPQFVEGYTKKCEELDKEYSEKLAQAMKENDTPRTIDNLERVVRLRRGLYLKERHLATRVAPVREAAELCDRIAGTLEGGNREIVQRMAHDLWFDLLRFGHDEAAMPGVPALKAWVDSTLQKLGMAEDADSSEVRRQMVDVLAELSRQNATRTWAEGRLREVALFYADALDRAAKRNDPKAAELFHRRGAFIWYRIVEEHPDDKQAEASLNRIDKVIKMFPD